MALGLTRPLTELSMLQLPTNATSCTMSLFPFSRLFPTCFGPSWGPSSGVFQAVVFMLPFGSCSALLIVCVRQRTGLWW